MTRIEFTDHIDSFLAEKAVSGKMVLLIDRNVHALYEPLFDEYDKIIVPSGESSKRFSLVEEIVDMLQDMGFFKDTLLIGVGGGVVTDITGFAASMYMRGISFGYIPTTLLSMCDAAIGGKNGINASGIKNFVGTFRQPEFITVWTDFLKTLPQKEFHSGMAEVIKHSILSGREFTEFLLSQSENILNIHTPTIHEMIQRSASLKLSVAEKDEFDRGDRHLLNFGHTVAHALELDTEWSHGECVAAGMVIDAEIALRMNVCDEETVNQIKLLVKTFKLPQNISFPVDSMMEKIESDKKRSSANIRYILPAAIGDCRIVEMSLGTLRKHLKVLMNE